MSDAARNAGSLVQHQTVVTTITLPSWLGGHTVRIETEDEALTPVCAVREAGEQEWVPVDEVEGQARTWRKTTYEERGGEHGMPVV